MVLLVFHHDKNDSAFASFYQQELRVDLGFFPKKNTNIILKQVGWYNHDEGTAIHLSFPDLSPQYLQEERVDESDFWEVPGLTFHADGGCGLGIAQYPTGRWIRSSSHRDVNLHLGVMDTQKDFFTIIVNSRRAVDDEDNPDLNSLNNITVVIEMIDGGKSH